VLNDLVASMSWYQESSIVFELVITASITRILVLSVLDVGTKG